MNSRTLSIWLAWLILCCLAAGCEKVSPDAVDLTVEFTWEGMPSCDWGNPEMSIGNIPAATKSLEISMFDHVYRHDHGSVVVDYRGQTTFEQGQFKAIQGPCPPGSPGRYKLTVKAMDENDVVIALGAKERLFPEE